MSHPLKSPLLDQFRATISHLRHIRLGIRTKSGRPSKAPQWYAVTTCVDASCGGMSIVQSGKNIGSRWACVTCKGLSLCAWTDGPAPDEEEIRAEFAKWLTRNDRKKK